MKIFLLLQWSSGKIILHLVPLQMAGERTAARKWIVKLIKFPYFRFTQTCNTLTITDVSPEDEGTYSCHNGQDGQYEDISDTLRLKYCSECVAYFAIITFFPLSPSPVKPAIVGDLTFTKKNPDEGDETTASCVWTGSPDPVVTWYKDGSPLREEDLPSRIRITMSREGEIFQSNLEIDEVELSDTGDYTCNVSNPVGFDTRVEKLEVSGIH